MMSVLLFALPAVSVWWWLVGIGIVIVLLTAWGRAAAGARVAGQLPPDQGPDLKPTQSNQHVDIPSDDQKQRP